MQSTDMKTNHCDKYDTLKDYIEECDENVKDACVHKISDMMVADTWKIEKKDFLRYMDDREVYHDWYERSKRAKRYNIHKGYTKYGNRIALTYLFLCIFVAGCLLGCVFISSIGDVQTACEVGFGVLAVFALVSGIYRVVGEWNALKL